MLKKCFRSLIVSCLLVGIFTNTTFAVSQDEFLKFLINSTYPEATVKEKNNKEVKDKKEEQKDTNEQKKSNDNENKKEDESQDAKVNKEYVKVFVGEENIPKEDAEEENSKAVSSLNYKNDMRVTKDNPKILIYHTHGCETYSNSPKGNYHSTDKVNSVMEVGSVLTSELANKGWGVVHTTKYHDYPSYNNSYSSSLKTVKELLPKYPSVDIAIDLHRDARDIKDKATKEKDHKKYTTEIDGKRVAKFFFVIGGKNDNSKELRALAEDINKVAQKKFPGLVSPIIEKDYARFNQFAAKKHLLIEIGSNATTIEEAKETSKYVAEILDEYFRQNGEANI
ncbi:stage II sporulation protein P [Clostridioides mangenotii]|uniref:stage II sporulation protein P n=1 Tax=Metaclostridioides mangenotii TaxID=1540 RepID=UPI00214A8B2A|nr:stage II sporulation protein P [Clostridioides mangenotii]MCR1955875.1 stage II sporulation protein P [Clostridioides mangenotii]